MTASVFRAGVLALGLLLLAAARGYAQPSPPPAPPPPAMSPATRPVTGFVPSYEIMKTVLSAGFHPLAPPLREGTTYVLRATDFRGILMRVVIDARTGTIRDVNRIVPGPGSYGQIENEPPPYGMPPPYNPTDYGAPMAPRRQDIEAPSGQPQPMDATSPPLPRPRPAALVSRKSTDDANLPAKSLPPAQPGGATNVGANRGQAATASPAAIPGAAPKINTEVITAAPSPAAAPKKTNPPVAPLND